MSDTSLNTAVTTADARDVAYAHFHPSLQSEVERLHAHVFGPGRFSRTAFRLRETSAILTDHCFVAQSGEALIGSVTMSSIAVGAVDLALLGPLAVHPDHRDVGIGRALLQMATNSAFGAGLPAVLLVGDAPYYASVGYQVVTPGTVQLPGPVDPRRLLMARNPDMAMVDIAGLAVGRGA